MPGVTRTWIDADADWVPDCDLANPQPNGNAAATYGGGGPDFCGVISNLRFGQPVLTGRYDPDLLSGWGVRAGDWSFGLSVQQQLLQRMSIEVGYYRRSFDGFSMNDNVLLESSDLTPYTDHRAVGFAASRWWRIPSGNALRRRSRQVRTSRQPGDAC